MEGRQNNYIDRGTQTSPNISTTQDETDNAAHENQNRSIPVQNKSGSQIDPSESIPTLKKLEDSEFILHSDGVRPTYNSWSLAIAGDVPLSLETIAETDATRYRSARAKNSACMNYQTHLDRGEYKQALRQRLSLQEVLLRDERRERRVRDKRYGPEVRDERHSQNVKDKRHEKKERDPSHAQKMEDKRHKKKERDQSQDQKAEDERHKQNSPEEHDEPKVDDQSITDVLVEDVVKSVPVPTTQSIAEASNLSNTSQKESGLSKTQKRRLQRQQALGKVPKISDLDYNLHGKELLAANDGESVTGAVPFCDWCLGLNRELKNLAKCVHRELGGDAHSGLMSESIFKLAQTLIPEYLNPDDKMRLCMSLELATASKSLSDHFANIPTIKPNHSCFAGTECPVYREAVEAPMQGAVGINASRF